MVLSHKSVDVIAPEAVAAAVVAVVVAATECFHFVRNEDNSLAVGVAVGTDGNDVRH